MLDVGIIDGKYYEGGVIKKAAGVVLFENKYYFVRRDGSVLTGSKIAVNEENANGLVPAGTYRADENGRLDITGIYNGKYYEDGRIKLSAGVVQFKGSFYFIMRDGSVFTDGKITVNKNNSNGLVPLRTYKVGENGKLPITGVLNGYYYKDGTLAQGVGIIEFEGDLYFIKNDGSVFVGSLNVKESKTNGLIKAGTYVFDKNGKLIG